MEAGFPIASPGDFEAVHKIASEIKGPVIAALARITEKDIDRAGEALKPAARRRIHTFSSGSDIHLEAMMRLTRAQNLDKSVKAVKMARAYTSDIEYSAQDTTRSDRKYLVELYTAVAEAGATTLNVPDTVGYAIPEEYGDMIAYLVANVKVPGIVFSVHCHNDLGLAVANSLAGVSNGARQVECTINGLGERAGNAALEELVMALRTRHDRLPYTTTIHTETIMKASRLVSAITGFVVQPNKAIVGANAFAHESGIHQDGMLKHAGTYEIMTPESVGLVRAAADKAGLVLGKHSGRNAFRTRLRDLGYAPDDAVIDETFKRFKELADKKKEIFDEDLIALVDDRIGHAGDRIQFVSLDVVAGSRRPQRALLVLTIDGETRGTEAGGNGPVDATFNAIKELFPHEARLGLYQVHAVTAGTDAQAEVTVRLEDEDRGVVGRGADSDTLVASCRAYVHALNKLLLKRQRTAPSPLSA